MELLLDELHARELSCAPHVVARLASTLTADAATVTEVVARLTVDQRRGLRELPMPLPLVPAIEREFAAVELGARDRLALLTAASMRDDELATLLVVDGRGARELASSPVGRFLSIHAGRLRFTDPRAAVWILGTATADEAARMHTSVAAALSLRGDREGAAWHRARASLVGEPEAAARLIAAARRSARGGDDGRALLLAKEAAKHTDGEARDEARLLAGAAALAEGYAADAAAWFGSLFPHAAERRRLRALAGLLAAQTQLQGTVPEVDPALVAPSTGDPADWRWWTRAAAVAAVLCAERGDRARMRSWLDAVRQGSACAGADTGLRAPVVALSWLLAGEVDVEDADGRGPVCGTLLGALRSASRGDLAHGLRLLRSEASFVATSPDPLASGFERSAVVRAALAVAETLLLTWQGDLGPARERLRRAAVELPVALPFAGRGVVLARRLDLAVLGSLGPVARALTAVAPSAVGMDVLVDRGIEAFLAGSFDDAATAIELWLDHGAPEPFLAVPGLDEVAVTARALAGPVAVRPPELATAHELRVRIATAENGSWCAERDAVREAARALRSPFARASVETMLGIQHALRDDHLPARIHLQQAERLFEAAGATAWARAARNRLDRLEATAAQVVPPLEQLAACRRVWSRRLTARELDVAMLAVRGTGNRRIAEELRVSVRTVEVHLGRVFGKLSVRNRVELTVLAHRIERHL